MAWHNNMMDNAELKIHVTFNTSGMSGDIPIISRHTCPATTTRWWPYTVKTLLNAEMNSKNVTSVSLVEIEYVT